MSEQPDPPTTVGEFWDAFKEFLDVTPEELSSTPTEEWECLFAGRMEFENWRQRWLAYYLGFIDGPTTPEQYAQLRHKLFTSPRGRNVDHLHTAVPR